MFASLFLYHAPAHVTAVILTLIFTTFSPIIIKTKHQSILSSFRPILHLLLTSVHLSNQNATTTTSINKMSSSTEPTPSTAPHDTTTPKTTRKKKKSKKSKKSTKSRNKKPSSSSSSSKGRSNPTALTGLQQALARQQQTIREGTALLAARFRAGLYFWPLDTSLGRVPSGGDRFFVQDVVMPLRVGGSGGAKTPLSDGARHGDDHGGGGGGGGGGDGDGDGDVDRAGAELEAGLEMDQDHQQGYVARAQAEAAELARRFQEGLSDEGCGFEGEKEEKDGDEEEEEKEDGELEKQPRRRRQQQQWRSGNDKGHRGRLLRLANEARTVTVYRLEDVVGQRQPVWGGHCICTW